MEESLDFELEDPIISSRAVTNKRKKKVIGLDDLLADFYSEKSKNLEKESKRAKAPEKCISDEEQDIREASLSKLVDECQTQMIEMSGDEDCYVWGVQIFQGQKSPPPVVTPSLESCGLFQSFMNNELNSLVELSSENGDSFIEGLLKNGWLLKLVLTRGHVEESIATWTFNLMLYSSKEELRTPACHFWSVILKPRKEPIKIYWFPSYSDLRKALEVYGFLFLSDRGTSNANSSCGGPAQNIRFWIKFITASCQVRSKWSVCSTSEAEELAEVIVSFFVDRQLQGLSVLLYECMQAVISYFTDKEWKASWMGKTNLLLCTTEAFHRDSIRVPKDLNCIRLVECISGVDDRSKHLRSAVAYQILLGCFDNKAGDDELLRLLIAINVKEKKCNLFKLYIYLVMAENWLLATELLEDKPVLTQMWCLFLRNCSCLISSTDLRSYAAKVRDRASFLLQGATKI